MVAVQAVPKLLGGIWLFGFNPPVGMVAVQARAAIAG
jgi:hypothetical protein